MTDQMSYMNAYVDTLMGMIHEHIITAAQNKTQLRINNDIIQKQTEEIERLLNIANDLQARLNTCESTKANENNAANLELANAGNELAQLRNEVQALRSKSAHVDDLLNQVVAMKNEIINRDEKIQKLNQKILDLKNPVVPKKSRKNKKEEALETF